MLVNVSQAAKLANISRDTFYKNYINKGKISISRDGRNRPMVDTSEILRVFGSLQTDTVRDSTKQTQGYTEKDSICTVLTPLETAKVQQLEQENQYLKERLAELQQLYQETKQEAKEREEWQRGQIEKLTDTIKLLEAPKAIPTKNQNYLWWIKNYLKVFKK